MNAPSPTLDLLALLERSGGGYTVFDSTFRIRFEGPSNHRIHGWSPGDLIGRSLMEFLHPDELERLGARFQRILGLPGTTDSDTVRFRHKLGHWVTLEGFVCNCLEDPRIGGILNSFRDVSERAAAQEELRRAKEAAEDLAQRQKRFLAQVSHEFRTPITLVRLPLESLPASVAGTEAGPAVAEACALALRNLDRLDHLVSELVELSRADADHGHPRFAERDLVAFLKTQLELYRSAIAGAGLNLIWEGPLECRLFFDAAQLQKVIANLVSNAIRHTPRDGRIYVRCAADAADAPAPHVTITVTDTGEGMDEAVRARAFERFFQGPRFGAEPSDGMGIGLSLVKEIVERHGGTVSLASMPRTGTSVEVRLPLTSEHITGEEIVASPIEPPAEESTPRDAGVSTSPEPAQSAPAGHVPARTLLIVEDTRDLRHYLRGQLASAFNVLEAADGMEALALLESRRVDVVLCDVMMPRMDGLGFCRTLVARRGPERPPVVLLSAKDHPDDRAAGLEAGATDYLGKPFHIRELRLRLDKACPPPANGPAEHEAAWLRRLEAFVDEHLADDRLSLDDLATAMGVSPRQLQRRVQELLGETPAATVRRLRLQAARDRIARRAFATMAEVAASVGMSTSYFYRAYRAYFGATPTFPPA